MKTEKNKNNEEELILPGYYAMLAGKLLLTF
jgi:hypothetical protein